MYSSGQSPFVLCAYRQLFPYHSTLWHWDSVRILCENFLLLLTSSTCEAPSSRHQCDSPHTMRYTAFLFLWLVCLVRRPLSSFILSHTWCRIILFLLHLVSAFIRNVGCFKTPGSSHQQRCSEHASYVELTSSPASDSIPRRNCQIIR